MATLSTINVHYSPSYWHMNKHTFRFCELENEQINFPLFFILFFIILYFLFYFLFLYSCSIPCVNYPKNKITKPHYFTASPPLPSLLLFAFTSLPTTFNLSGQTFTWAPCTILYVTKHKFLKAAMPFGISQPGFATANHVTLSFSLLHHNKNKMEGMMDSSAVTLVVKTPNRSIDDLQISCALNWTVEKLKTHLSNVYPSKPVGFLSGLCYGNFTSCKLYSECWLFGKFLFILTAFCVKKIHFIFFRKVINRGLSIQDNFYSTIKL